MCVIIYRKSKRINENKIFVVHHIYRRIKTKKKDFIKNFR